MKTIYLIFIIFFSIQSSFAQGLKIIYEEKANPLLGKDLTKIEDPNIRAMLESQLKSLSSKEGELLVSEGVSLFTVNKSEDSKEINSNNKVIRGSLKDFSGKIFYKNQQSKELLRVAEVDNKTYIVNETMPEIEWKIGTKQKNVAGYNCIEASAVLNNQNLIAWYCPDIAINDGPGIYWGLPGLILEIEINNGARTYTCTLLTEMKNTEIQKPSQGEKISKDEYDKVIKAKMQEANNKQATGTGSRVRL